MLWCLINEMEHCGIHVNGDVNQGVWVINEHVRKMLDGSFLGHLGSPVLWVEEYLTLKTLFKATLWWPSTTKQGAAEKMVYQEIC